MHLTMPKASREQRRAAVNSIQRPPAPLNSPEHTRPDRRIMRQTAVPSHSLNKYKVLPPIKRRQSEVSLQRSLDRQMSKLSLTDEAVLQQRHRHEEPDLQTVTRVSSSEVKRRADVLLRVCPKPPDPGPVMTKDAGAPGSLFPAIQAPCDPADTPLTVRAGAEVRYGDVSMESMDVRRGTPTDMDVELDQCGVLNRSLVGASPSGGVVE